MLASFVYTFVFSLLVFPGTVCLPTDPPPRVVGPEGTELEDMFPSKSFRNKNEDVSNADADLNKELTPENEIALSNSKRGDSSNNSGTIYPADMQASYFLGQCVMCPPGDLGPHGAPGPQGMPGRDGRDAIYMGPAPPGGVPSRPPDDIPCNKYNGTLPGVTYVRWGRKTCPKNAELVYEGVMGGSHYSQKGSGANYLCLPVKPKFGSQSSMTMSAYIYGVEYETGLPKNSNLRNSEASCAVCLAKGEQSVLVIPAADECFGEDWTLQYKGYMMSSSYAYYKSEFVCVDDSAEGIPRTSYSNNEGMLYAVRTTCGTNGGGLPCPPYQTAALLCAVCTI